VVVLGPPSPTPPDVVVSEEVPEFVGVVAEVVVVDVEVVLDVLVVVGVLVEVVVVVVGVLVAVVVVGGVVVVAWCWRQSLAASRAIVAAPWVRLLRSVGLTVTGRL
jgi:hypothetical protein